MSPGRALFHCDFVDARLMASALERSVEEHVDNLSRQRGVDEVRGKHEHIGIVMSAGETREFDIPAKSSAHTLMLVERHTDTVARTAYGDSRIYVAALDGFGAGMCEIRIVTAVGTVGAEIDERRAVSFEITFEKRF